MRRAMSSATTATPPATSGVTAVSAKLRTFFARLTIVMIVLRLSYRSKRNACRIYARCNVAPYVRRKPHARSLQGNRSDGYRPSFELHRLVRDRAHRSLPRHRHHLSRDRGARAAAGGGRGRLPVSHAVSL